MAPDGGIGREAFGAVELLRKGHLVVKTMDGRVAEPTDVDTPIERRPIAVFAKAGAPVEFAGNQVVKREPTSAPAYPTVPCFVRCAHGSI